MKRLITVVVFLAVSAAFPAFSAPRAELWPRWTERDPSSTVRIDHSRWTAFLSRYLEIRVDGTANRLSYSEVTPGDAAILDAYIDDMQKVGVGALSGKEQYAYWVNLYNAVTVKLILDNYPVASIRDIKTGGLFGKGPWDIPLLKIEGEDVTLNDIEHRILRPVWQDPRTHYAVNCASIGCPNLQPVAFDVENTESLLEKAAREYVNSPRGASFRDGRLVLSSIYTWFEEDFGGSREGVIEHLARHAEPELAGKLAGHEGRVRYEYDWNLNKP